MYDRNNRPKSYFVNSKENSMEHNVKYENILNKLESSGGPIYCTFSESSINGGHAVVIIGAYQYKKTKHVIYYDPNESEGIIDGTYDDKRERLNGKKVDSISEVDYDKFD